MKNIHKQTGFTLVEVLIALLIFAVGLLGLSGLKLRAHQTAKFAHSQTVATLQATSMVEKMRSNLAGVAANDYVYNFNADGDSVADADCAPASVNPCSATERAATDIAEWVVELNNSIPIANQLGAINAGSANVQICRDANPELIPPAGPGSGIVCEGGVVQQWTLYIDWTDRRDIDNTNQLVRRYAMTFIP